MLVAPDGEIIVRPDAGFAGDIEVPYTISDQDGAQDNAVHTVTVPNAVPEVVDPDPAPGTPSIDPLDIHNIIVPAIDGKSITIDLDDYLADDNSHSLEFVPEALPAGATFNSVTNELTFVPAVDNTEDTIIPFIVDDGNGGVLTSTVTIQPVNPPPQAVDETVHTEFETPIVIDLLVNDFDPDQDPLTVIEINGVVTSVTGQPLSLRSDQLIQAIGGASSDNLLLSDDGVSQTIVVANGIVTIASDGTITVTPDEGFSGTITVPYTIEDQDGATSSAVHYVIVPNAPPVVIEPEIGAAAEIDPEDPANIVVPAVDGEPITIDLDNYLSDPNGGELTINFESLPKGATFDPVTNELTFVPAINNEGDIVLPVTVIDSAGSEITPTITIQPINPPPVASPESVTTEAETPVVVDFLANDSDPDKDTISLLGTPVIGDPSNGVLELVGDDWVFTPASGFSGEAVIAYTVQDQDGTTATSTHTVVVAGVSFTRPDEPVPVYVAPPQQLIVVPDTDYERNYYRIDADPAVLSMAEGLSSLSGIDNIAALNTAQDLLLIDGSEGFSSGKGYRGTHSVDPTDECGRVFVDTIVKTGGLSIIARSTIDPNLSSGVTGFTVVMANGDPLPLWISEISDSEFLLDRSVDLESVALKIIAHQANGTDLVRHVEIDTLTGQIRELHQTTVTSESFLETLDTAQIDE